MALTALGRAIESGADGEVIQVMNVQSKKTVQALVVGPNLVQVALPFATLPN
jgi:flagella basal body P-ring formation protein FlgA